ncbi:MAG TPA: STAS domain-containing protein [Acidimicrobiales bacterium]|nr:STAS domain-containing protein [Acidimicrobiales bacterium]
MTTALTQGCRIETATDGPNRIIEVTGTLNWRAAPALRAAVSAADPEGRLLIDLTDVAAIDSAGTGALIAAHLRAAGRGTALAVLTGDAVADVVDGVGIGDAALVFSDRAAAYAWLSGERAGYPLGR